MIIDALRYEWVRIRTIRSTWWLTGAAFVVGVAIAVLVAAVFGNEFNDHPPTDADIEGLGAIVVTQLAATGVIPSLVGFLLAIVGIFAWGHEYRHGMVRASLTALSSRTSFYAAKLLVVGAWVVAAQLVTMVVSGLIATIFLSDYVSVFDSRSLAVMAWQLLSTLLLTWLAMAFTLLTRSQAFALVAIFLWPLLVETLINTFFLLVPALRENRGVLRFLPFSAQKRMVSALDDTNAVFGDPLSPLGGALVLALVTVVLMGAAFVLFRQRDA